MHLLYTRCWLVGWSQSGNLWGLVSNFLIILSKICANIIIFHLEIDDLSYTSAMLNIANNHLSNRIQVLKLTSDEMLLAPLSKFSDVR